MYVFRAIKMYKGVSMFKSKAKTLRNFKGDQVLNNVIDFSGRGRTAYLIIIRRFWPNL